MKERSRCFEPAASTVTTPTRVTSRPVNMGRQEGNKGSYYPYPPIQRPNGEIKERLCQAPDCILTWRGFKVGGVTYTQISALCYKKLHCSTMCFFQCTFLRRITSWHFLLPTDNWQDPSFIMSESFNTFGVIA